MFSTSAINPFRDTFIYLLTTKNKNFLLKNCFQKLENLTGYGSLALASIASIIQIATVTFAIVSASTGGVFAAVVITGTALAALAILLAIAAAIFRHRASIIPLKEKKQAIPTKKKPSLPISQSTPAKISNLPLLNSKTHYSSTSISLSEDSDIVFISKSRQISKKEKFTKQQVAFESTKDATEEMEQQLETEIKTKESLLKDNNKLRHEIEVLKQTLKDREETNDGKDGERIIQALTQRYQLIEKLRKECQAAKDENLLLNSQLKKADQLLEKLKRKLQKHLEKKEKLEKELEELTKKEFANQSVLEALGNELKILNSQIAQEVKLNGDLKEAFRLLKDKHKEEKDAWQKELCLEIRRRERLESEIEGLKEVLQPEEASKAMPDSPRRIELLEQMKEMMVEHRNLQDKIAEYDKETASLKKQIATLSKSKMITSVTNSSTSTNRPHIPPLNLNQSGDELEDWQMLPRKSHEVKV